MTRPLRDIPAGVVRRSRRYAGAAKRRAGTALRAASGRIGVARETVRWNSAVRRGRAGAFRVEPLLSRPLDTALPVIVCMWKRPQRIEDILRQLDAQSVERGIRLLIWNNLPDNDDFYRSRIAAFTPQGALRSVEYHSSAVNVGGIGRFFLARKIRAAGYRGHFAMLDDDQDITPRFADDLLDAAAPREFGGVWAWNYVDSHWNRTETPPGAAADYVGTGGSVCDIEIVREDDFFTGLPRRFAFLEDQWLCGYARARGWTLRKIDTPYEFVLDETNQFHTMADLKNEFRDYLTEMIARASP
ncbi:hypothetical protein [Microterricola viridarii]|uniref:hypothetical protein n=1 Tax=Microterricola viridarii TaxID=412690 RepID=UPI0012EA39EB|nr:hypothetical protein [Microterricola viridarii]